MVVLFACGGTKSTQPSPEPSEAQDVAEQAFNEMGESNPVQSMGNNTDIMILTEPSDIEITEVRTGEPGWVVVEQTMPFNDEVPFAQARKELLQFLRNEAVKRKIPHTVEVTSLLTDMMSESNGVANEQSTWSGFFKSTVSGVITAEKILMDEFPREIKNGYEKTMKLRAYVEPVSGQRDPGFYVDVVIENNMLKQGDELIFTVQPSKDCYVYIFNLMADHNAMLMFPNEYLKENYVEEGDILKIPDDRYRQYIKFMVGVLPGQQLTTESVYIVCVKDSVEMIDTLPKIGTSIEVLSGESGDFVKLQRWLTNIPLDRRVEKNLIYHVSDN